MNNKSTVRGIFCDIKKYFNCVNNILLSKMEFYGIPGKEKTLYKHYLNNRYQTVNNKQKYKNTILSKWSEIKNSVPQSSILGPKIIKSVDTSTLFTHRNPKNVNINIHMVF